MYLDVDMKAYIQAYVDLHRHLYVCVYADVWL